MGQFQGRDQSSAKLLLEGYLPISIMKTPMSLSSARMPALDCRLLYLVGELGPGGQEKQLYYLLKAMDRERYKPMGVVWSYNENDTYVRQIRDLGVQVFPLPGTFSRLLLR